MTTAERGERQRTDEPPKAPREDPFDAIGAGYHERIRAAVTGYEKRLQELRSRYFQAVEAAKKEQTPEAAQKRFDEANAEAAQGIRDLVKTANDEVVASLRKYAGDLKQTWASADVEGMTAPKLAYLGQQVCFIANAARGAYPPAWWNPRT
jgi:hypothetical protein